MYELKEITLKNQGYEKKRLVIQFDKIEYIILAEFLMSDAQLLKNELLAVKKALDTNKTKEVTLTGNRCAIKLEKEKTTITDLFDGIDESSYQDLTISTNQFFDYLTIWNQEIQKFNNKNK